MHDTPCIPPVLDDGPWRRLWHRWFIQYNPLYLVSAALVLVGVILSSQGLAGAGMLGQLGISAIAEVYAWALIGGAALLVRIRLRRPAVMLSLLAALYQCDLTLHTETCAHLGTIGALGSLVWLVGFVAKLYALAWAMELRVSPSAFVVTSLGAATIALFPWLLRTLDGDSASALLGVWLFALLAAALWSPCRVESRVAEPSFAATVARRSIRATFAGWAVMLLVHVGFWLSQHATLHATALVPAGMLLCTRLVRREGSTWLIVLGTLAYVGVEAPSLLSPTAGMAAVALGLRALRWPTRHPAAAAVAPTVSGDVYRLDATVDPTPPAPVPPPHASFVLAPPAARLRLLTGAAWCLYLAVWTHGWSGGPWPVHAGWLDALWVITSLVAFARTRRSTVLVPPALALMHLAVALRIVSGPQSPLQWGMTCIGLGFGLLLLSLVASVRWRRRVLAGSAG